MSRTSKHGRALKQSSATKQKPGGVREITLQNPVREHFATFIFGNATKCERVVEKDSAKGQHLVICGAGPSLRETAGEYCPTADQVWGCNSAVTWLHTNGHKVTHGFTVDQTAHMLAEWASVPPVDYLIASSCNPFLVELLEAQDRRVTFFHNLVGIVAPPVAYGVCQQCNTMLDTGVTPCVTCGATEIEAGTASYEEWLYAALYPSTIVVGSGLNATTRALDLALFMGFETITVLGADCALRASAPMPKGLITGSPSHLAWLRENTVMHADGGHALASEASCLTLEGEIDGRVWLTKPDLAITAIWLVWMRRIHGDKIRIVGDGLPAALMDKPEEFLNRLPMLSDASGNPIRFTEMKAEAA